MLRKQLRLDQNGGYTDKVKDHGYFFPEATTTRDKFRFQCRHMPFDTKCRHSRDMEHFKKTVFARRCRASTDNDSIFDKVGQWDLIQDREPIGTDVKLLGKRKNKYEFMILIPQEPRLVYDFPGEEQHVKVAFNAIVQQDMLELINIDSILHHNIILFYYL